MTKGGLRLYFNAGKIAHFFLAYKKLNKTDRLQKSICNGTANLYINLRSVCLFVCIALFFSAPIRPSLPSEVPNEGS